MSELHEDNPHKPLTVASVGEVLKAARTAKHLDIDDVCSYLRLSRRQVVALENNDFDALPEPTITRGFIRNYARMLDLDADPLLQEYRRSASADQTRPISISSANILISGNDKRPWLVYILASVLIVLAVGAWVVYVDYIPKPQPELEYAPTETEILASDAVVQHTEPVEPVSAADVSVLHTDADESMQTEPVAASTVAPVTATETQNPLAAVPAGQATVRLSARERSWVRITDRDNKNVFDQILVAGADETVQGQPPLQVVIGNAPGTTLVFNGQIIDLASSTNDRVARLKLE